MNCPECKIYQKSHGKGTVKCLTCVQYIEIVKTSGKRSTIAIDTIPDIILENVPDEKITTIIDALRQIPLEYSVPLVAYYYLNASQRELANYFKCSQQSLSLKIKKSIELIKKIPIND
jgi:hypothetical protein